MSFLEQIDKKKIPNNVAIIMDGNGRWAKSRKSSRIFGHRNSLNAVRDSVEVAIQLNISVLSLYCFSTENWSRPKVEINALMGFFVEVCQKELSNLQSRNVCVRVVGNTQVLPNKTQSALKKITSATFDNTGLKLVLCVNYGAKQELIDVVKNIAEKVKTNKLSLENIDDVLFEKMLYTRELPPLDLLIRTSGEQRISNFMLWQIAYTELYFTDVLWPDFNKEEFYKALISYQDRQRRFGKTSEQLSK